MTTPLIGMPQGMEWLVILAIVVLVFGAAKLPDLARSSGQALRIFKSETRAARDEDEAEGEIVDEKATPEQREIEARQHQSSTEAQPVDERRSDGTVA